jgi:hypothetical protein
VLQTRTASRVAQSPPLAQPLFQLFASDDAMNENDALDIEHLMEDSKVTNPQPQKFIVRTLESFDQLRSYSNVG